MDKVELRLLEDDDLPVLFRQQLDREANYMAAFTADDPADEKAFAAHWARIRSDPTTTNRIILYDGEVAGYIASFFRFGEREVSYWLGREYWGKGIATEALRRFLAELDPGPLSARAVKDNLASIRVLEKCGFVLSGEDRGYANARDAEVEEVIMTLPQIGGSTYLALDGPGQRA